MFNFKMYTYYIKFYILKNYRFISSTSCYILSIYFVILNTIIRIEFTLWLVLFNYQLDIYKDNNNKC